MALTKMNQQARLSSIGGDRPGRHVNHLNQRSGKEMHMTSKSLKRLPVLLAILAFSISLHPKTAVGSSCNMTCWENNCKPIYFDCIDSGALPSACCRHAQECNDWICGTDCPRFC
jgi:hypothetical protein